MQVLGIDPGTALMGYGIVADRDQRLQAVEYGKFATPAGMAQPERLLRLHTGLTEVIARHRPDVVAVEELYFGRNITTALTVGQARGIVLLAAAQAGLPVAEYTPMQVKQSVAGSGRADKGQVQSMVQRLLGLATTPRPDDVADALAVALCCLHAWPLAERLRRLSP